MTKGQFIALEGPKAAGKTTLITALARQLPVGAVVLTKEPTPAFDLTREQWMSGVELAAAIAEDRRRHVTEVIAPALAAGRILICDRYILSSYAFHTRDGVPAAIVDELNREFPRPTLNLLLRVPADELRRRRTGRGTQTRLQSDDIEAENAAYLHYSKVMESLGVPSRIVDNATMIDHRQLLDLLRTRYCGSER